jgi:hypothetical protein
MEGVAEESVATNVSIGDDQTQSMESLAQDEKLQPLP